MSANPFEQNLERTQANYQPLTPLSHLARAAKVYPDHTAIIHGTARIPYSKFYARARRLASMLATNYIGKGDAVSVMLPNTPAMLDAHFGVPMTGAVLHSINTRLDASIIAFQLDHANTKAVIVDREFSRVMKEALDIAHVKPLVIDYNDPEFPQDGEPLSYNDYEEFISKGDENFKWAMPDDEWDAIALNYTSGTTGNPKGVVYHHRGAALMCYANTVGTGMSQHPVYLWTLPMFHCNGWCFPWSLAVVAGTHVCLRAVRAKAMYDAICDHQVTHLSGAPIVMSVLLGASEDEKRQITHEVAFNHAAAPPPPKVLKQMTDAGFKLTHLYGLTETYGPAVINDWNTSWDDLPEEEQAQKRMRQGVRYAALEDLTVIDPNTMREVKADGETLGEVMFRGNIVMKGYLKNPKATEDAFKGGWFRSGDLGVLYPDGYIQLKDRSKDIIISGGENISSIEVEDVIYRHDEVVSCAVVAKPDDKWGETPCAIVELDSGSTMTQDDIIAWCREHLAPYKCPRHVVLAPVPKTSTGKVQKFKLREMVKDA